MENELLTAKEVAEALRISLRTTRTLLRSGAIKSHKLGHRTVRIKRTDLDAYLQSTAEDLDEYDAVDFADDLASRA